MKRKLQKKRKRAASGSVNLKSAALDKKENEKNSRNIDGSEKTVFGISVSPKKEHYYFLLIAALAAVLLLAGHGSRYATGNPTLPGEQVYYHLHLADVAADGAPSYDTSIAGSRRDYYTPYHYLLGYGGKMIDKEILARILPALLSIASLYFMERVLSLKREPLLEKMAMLTLFVISPAFLAMAIGSPQSMALFFTVLGAFLLLRGTAEGKGMQDAHDANSTHAPPDATSPAHQDHALMLLSLISFLFAALFSVLNGLIAAAVFGVLAFQQPSNPAAKKYLAAFAIIAGIMYFLTATPFFQVLEPQETNPLVQQVADLGAGVGFSIFFWILVIIGVISAWPRKKELAFLYAGTAALLAGSIFVSHDVNIITAVFFSLFAAKGLLRLQRTEWVFKDLQKITLLLIVCGLIFSSISFLSRVVNDPPRESMESMAQIIRETSDPDAVILSHPSNGYFIEAIGKRTAVLDSLSLSSRQERQKRMDMNVLLNTTDLEKAKQLLRKYHITHVLVTKEMREGGMWNSPLEGLLLLLRNSETFKNIASNEEAELWKVIER
ncbi:hypothetical protein HYU19_02075 [Candidatus Woesearchaeota archaeon]|nr:hypothetical protein [Candidatus Woesearchaeota archaeon]